MRSAISFDRRQTRRRRVGEVAVEHGDVKKEERSRTCCSIFLVAVHFPRQLYASSFSKSRSMPRMDRRLPTRVLRGRLIPRPRIRPSGCTPPWQRQRMASPPRGVHDGLATTISQIPSHARTRFTRPRKRLTMEHRAFLDVRYQRQGPTN